MFKIKLKAFLLHLVLSAIALSLIMILVILFWFPTPFLEISNFKEIAYILIAVDLVLGPILTFVAFNPSKKSLKFDLSAIVAVQIMALSYGIYSLFLSHPLYITYYNNSFNLVATNIAKPETAKHNSFKVSKLASPTIAFMNVTDENKGEIFTDMLNGGPDLEARAEYYEPYQDHLDTIIKNGLDPKINFNSESSKIKLDNFLNKNGKTVDDYVYVPLTGNGKKIIWVLKKDTGEPIDTINILPIITAEK